MLLEIACFNVQSALIAQENGADRVEFCAQLQEGGTTPDREETRKLRQHLKIPVRIMIRPRGGDFTYTHEEFQQMKQDLQYFKTIDVEGFVFGILTENNEIDIEKNSELVALASPFPCTFHRAFDKVTDGEKALEELISCGFATVLTSGQQPNVWEGKENLKTLVAQSDGRIEILLGGGLRSGNIRQLKEYTQAAFFHSSAITDGSETANPEEIRALKSQMNNG